MTRRLRLTLLRIYPGLAFLALAAGLGYVIGHHHGYVARAAEEFRWHTMWEPQE